MITSIEKKKIKEDETGKIHICLNEKYMERRKNIQHPLQPHYVPPKRKKNDIQFSTIIDDEFQINREYPVISLPELATLEDGSILDFLR